MRGSPCENTFLGEKRLLMETRCAVDFGVRNLSLGVVIVAHVSLQPPMKKTGCYTAVQTGLKTYAEIKRMLNR